MWALISGSPFYDEEGCFAGSLGMLTDITERKKYEGGLIESKERAEELARLKSTLLTNMSHEIRTPLTGILGFAEIIATHGSDRAPEYAEIITESGLRLMDTLNAVLELAQLESRSVVLTPERLDIVNLMREVLEPHEREACRKGLYLRLEHDTSYILSTSDRSALSRLFANLTNNALKFTDHGGVTIRLAHSDRSLRVEFEDTGIGIGESFIPQLFEDFKQESEGMTSNYEGVGLGQSIAKRLVDLLGGTIDVASTRGVGTTFTLQLPIALPNDSPVERKSALHQRLSSVDPYGRARDVA